MTDMSNSTINQGYLESPNDLDDQNAWQAEYEEEPEIVRCPYCCRWMYEEDVVFYAGSFCVHKYPLFSLNKD